jgi:hypothetical protein
MKAFLLAARAVPVEGYFRDIGSRVVLNVVRDIWS